jgi:hypothetical protein
MPTKHAVLGELTADELRANVDYYELEVADRRVKVQLVDALAGGGDGAFAAFAEVEAYARQHEIPLVPVLFRGRFRSVEEIRDFVARAHEAPSMLGGEREGVVLRLEGGFPAAEFQDSVCKSVRFGHVQTDEHWTRNWRPCRIEGRAE